jgi:hypothetical protein
MTRKTLLEAKIKPVLERTNYLLFRNLLTLKSDLFDVLEYVFNSEIKPITQRSTSSCSTGNNLP